jgi:hypothetical protein
VLADSNGTETAITRPAAGRFFRFSGSLARAGGGEQLKRPSHAAPFLPRANGGTRPACERADSEASLGAVGRVSNQ